MEHCWGVARLSGAARNATSSASGSRLQSVQTLPPKQPSDAEVLIERCRKGDQAAWARLVESFQSLVYSIPKRMGLQDTDSADVFQATFLALYQNLDRIESGQALPKWLAVTASREALRVKRLSKRGSGDPLESLENVLSTEETWVEEEAARAVDAETVRRAIQKLPGRCVELIRALFYEGQESYSNIAARLGLPTGSLGPTRARCLEKLRKVLTEWGFFGEDVSTRSHGGS